MTASGSDNIPSLYAGIASSIASKLAATHQTTAAAMEALDDSRGKERMTDDATDSSTVSLDTCEGVLPVCEQNGLQKLLLKLESTTLILNDPTISADSKQLNERKQQLLKALIAFHDVKLDGRELVLGRLLRKLKECDELYSRGELNDPFMQELCKEVYSIAYYLWLLLDYLKGQDEDLIDRNNSFDSALSRFKVYATLFPSPSVPVPASWTHWEACQLLHWTESISNVHALELCTIYSRSIAQNNNVVRCKCLCERPVKVLLNAGSSATIPVMPSSLNAELQFDVPYHSECYNLKHVHIELLDGLQQWSEEVMYAPYVSIIQSSGTGKSRLMQQLSLMIPTISICLRDPGELSSFPLNTPYILEYLSGTESFDTYSDSSIQDFLFSIELPTPADKSSSEKLPPTASSSGGASMRTINRAQASLLQSDYFFEDTSFQKACKDKPDIPVYLRAASFFFACYTIIASLHSQNRLVCDKPEDGRPSIREATLRLFSEAQLHYPFWKFFIQVWGAIHSKVLGKFQSFTFSEFDDSDSKRTSSIWELLERQLIVEFPEYYQFPFTLSDFGISMLVCIDEVHILADRTLDGCDYSLLAHINRAARLMKVSSRSLLVSMDTLCKVDVFSSSKVYPSERERLANGPQKVITCFQTWDLGLIDPTARRMLNLKDDGTLTLKQLNDPRFSCLFGRPLWYSRILIDKASEAVGVAQTKLGESLLGPNDPFMKRSGVVDPNVAAAVVCVRTGLYATPFRDLSRNLVRSFMAYLRYFDEKTQMASVSYLPEPVVAAAARRIWKQGKTVQQDYRKQALGHISFYLRSSPVARGSRGEFVAILLILEAIDVGALPSCSVRELYDRLMSGSDKIISDEDFDSNCSAPGPLAKQFLNGLVYVQQFVQVHGYCPNRTTLWQFFQRGCAVICQERQEGFDLIIPVLLTDWECHPNDETAENGLNDLASSLETKLDLFSGAPGTAESSSRKRLLESNLNDLHAPKVAASASPSGHRPCRSADSVAADAEAESSTRPAADPSSSLDYEAPIQKYGYRRSSKRCIEHKFVTAPPIESNHLKFSKSFNENLMRIISVVSTTRTNRQSNTPNNAESGSVKDSEQPSDQSENVSSSTLTEDPDTSTEDLDSSTEDPNTSTEDTDVSSEDPDASTKRTLISEPDVDPNKYYGPRNMSYILVQVKNYQSCSKNDHIICTGISSSIEKGTARQSKQVNSLRFNGPYGVLGLYFNGAAVHENTSSVEPINWDDKSQAPENAASLAIVNPHLTSPLSEEYQRILDSEFETIRGLEYSCDQYRRVSQFPLQYAGDAGDAIPPVCHKHID